MKKIVLLLWAFCAASMLQAQSKKALRAQVASLQEEVATLEASLDSMESLAAKAQLNMEEESHKLSYALGLSVASGMKRQNNILDSLNLDVFAQAFSDTQEGAPAMNDMEAVNYLNQYFSAIEKAKSAEKIAAQEQFFEKNSQREGVVTLDNGMQYEVLTKGEGGAKPNISSEVTVHYTGMLADGTVFDSSIERGEPATFRLGQVIKGWQEALQLMSKGDKWKIYIPYELGYGERGAGQDIPPYAPLVFEVELLDFKE